MSCESTSDNDLPAYKSGTTWPGMTSGAITFDYAEAATLTRLVLAFKRSTTTLLTLDSDDVDSIVTANSDWTYEVGAMTPLGISAGPFRIEMTATDSTGYVRDVGTYNQLIL